MRTRTDTKSKSCTGKKPYTKTEANRVAEYQRRVNFANMQPYNCRHCPSWHIGHVRRSKR